MGGGVGAGLQYGDPGWGGALGSPGKGQQKGRTAKQVLSVLPFRFGLFPAPSLCSFLSKSPILLILRLPL